MTARLAYSLFHLLEGRGHRGDWREMDAIALRIARATADRHAEAPHPQPGPVRHGRRS